MDFQQIRDRYSLIEVVSRYVEIRKKGSEHVGLCPFHEDTKPSLTIYRGNDGVDRYRCFACGAGSEGGDVIDFVKAINNCDAVEAARILTGDEIPSPGSYTPTKPPPTQVKCWDSIIPVPDDAPAYDPSHTLNPKHGRIVDYRPVRNDTYFNAVGKIICHVVRLEFTDNEKACITVTYCEGPGGKRAWCAQRMEPPYPLQGLDELAARPHDWVMIVSGEKCKAVASQALPQFVVVSPMGGDQAANKVNIDPLRGRNTIFFPDADASGIVSMRKLQLRL